MTALPEAPELAPPEVQRAAASCVVFDDRCARKVALAVAKACPAFTCHVLNARSVTVHHRSHLP